ncbi:uncharacterized protein LOC126824914 isoform X1 [Patella vulgata]|uniref:uncharacterized protein LOC126824914 isoform X1 n=1 Tax=Patella vulgata TaxID=6465 RepID=UPI0024A9FC4B|nr:uncharacterized protein LOC126824914 isoform X1 [Patella vulgata]
MGIFLDMVQVEEITTGERSKRSADGELPKTMYFHLKSEKTDAKLRLRRAPNIELEVFVCDHGKITKKNVPNFSKSAIYINEATGTPMMVSEIGGYIELVGNTVVNGNSVNLKGVGKGKHRLTSEDNIHYGDDQVPLTAELEEKLNRYLKKKKRRNKNRVKRQATINTVEMLVVTDYSVKEKFLARHGNDDTLANSELKIYYALILLSMAARFDTVTAFEPSLVYRLEGAGIVITNNAADAPYNQDNNVDGVVQYIDGLNQFRTWANSNRGDLPPFDHAMWFTNDQLGTSTSTGVVGVAWERGMCSSYSFSIVEDNNGGRTGLVAAHELGHSAGGHHDLGQGACEVNDRFVMAPSAFFPTDGTKNNPWKFSECSVQNLTLYSDFFGCLRSDDNNQAALVTSELAGQFLDADEQCKLYFGNPGSYFCRGAQLSNYGFDLMCQRLLCFDPSSSNVCRPIAAQEFTSCGNQKWCQGGSCVSSSEAPVTKDVGFNGISPQTGFILNVINKYFQVYFPSAIQLALQMDILGYEERLVYTTHPWLVSFYLDCPPNLVLSGVKLQCPTPTQRESFLYAAKRGDITWHAGPMNMQYEALDVSMVEFSLQLSEDMDARIYQPRQHRTMSQRDVPGMTQALLPILARHGIEGITVGVNTVSSPPAVPKIFQWVYQNTSLIAMWHPGGYPLHPGSFPSMPIGLSRDNCVTFSEFEEAMCFSFRGDNQGPPQSVQEVLTSYEIVRGQFPGAYVQASTFEDFVGAAQRIKDKLPVVDKEIGDTWIQGISSDPTKVAQMRAFFRARADCLETGKCSNIELPVYNASRVLVKLAEHTWGLNNVKDSVNWTNDLFTKQLENKAPNFENVISSWSEQRGFLDLALETLGSHPLAEDVRQQYEDLVPVKPDLSCTFLV